MSAGGTEVEQTLACLATLFYAGQVGDEAPADTENLRHDRQAAAVGIDEEQP